MEISQGHLFGEPLFLQTLIQFLIRARDADEMNDKELQLWETALTLEESDDGEADTAGADQNDGPLDDAAQDQNDEFQEPKDEYVDEGETTPRVKRAKSAIEAAVPGNHRNITQRHLLPSKSDSPPPLTE